MFEPKRVAKLCKSWQGLPLKLAFANVVSLRRALLFRSARVEVNLEKTLKFIVFYSVS